MGAVALSVLVCACSRSGLFAEGEMGYGLDTVDAATRVDAGPDADEDAADAQPDGPMLVPQAFVCPERVLDECGDNAYEPGSPWPTFQRCSSHTGATTAIGPKNPVLLWQTSLLGGTVLSPATVAADGTVYAGGAGALYATSSTGVAKWNAMPSVFNTGSSTAAIGPDGTTYFAIDRVYATSPNGSPVWSSYQLAYPGPQSSYGTLASPGSSVTLGPCGTLFIGSPTGLHIMDGNGNAIWDVPGEGLTPAVDRMGNAYYGTADGRLLAVNPNGTVRWTYSLNADDSGTRRWIQPAPVLGPDGTLYFGETVGFHAISSEGVDLWTVPWGPNATGPLVGAALAPDGTVYVSFPDGTLRALTPDGTTKWSFDTEVQGSSPIVDGAGTVYELATDGVFAISSTGDLVWVITLPDATTDEGSLSMGGDGTLYVTADALYALGDPH
jgi:hypothetical protein